MRDQYVREQLTDIALSLCERIDLPREQLYRLAGVELSSFSEIEGSSDPESVLNPGFELRAT